MVPSLMVYISMLRGNCGESGKGTRSLLPAQLHRWQSLGRSGVGAGEDGVLPPGRKLLQLPCQSPHLLL